MRTRIPWLIAILFVAVASTISFAGIRLLAHGHALRGLRLGGVDVGGTPLARLHERVEKVAESFLDQTMLLTLGDEKVTVKRSQLGFRIDVEAACAAVRRAGRSGDPVVDVRDWWQARRRRLDLALPLTLDHARAFEVLSQLKEVVDRAPVDAHLDLDRHMIAPEKPGVLLQVYESLVELERFGRRGASEIALRAVALPAGIERGALPRIDMSTVLGRWETHYTSTGTDSDRAFNLKVGAEHLNGHVLMPQQRFSFNDVVGPRTETQGYRVAPVIQAGEMIDGLAGGMCQIASTLHAAAFFAGLEIVSSTPHSRPSAYIPLGLDATVVYPSTNLVLRNPFDFPVVIHYSVNQGKVAVELLGRQRPYRVVFEREITQETRFGSGRRRDPTAPAGQRLLLQEGYPGYHVLRRRYLLDGKATLPKRLGSPGEPLSLALERAHITPIRVDKWSLAYPSTEQISAVGSGPRRLKKKPKPPAHHIPPVPKDQKPIGRIVQ